MNLFSSNLNPLLYFVNYNQGYTDPGRDFPDPTSRQTGFQARPLQIVQKSIFSYIGIHHMEQKKRYGKK